MDSTTTVVGVVGVVVRVVPQPLQLLQLLLDGQLQLPDHLRVHRSVESTWMPCVYARGIHDRYWGKGRRG
eukprot:COSAG05_NODE_2322_length_3236_cov_2.431304_3_plen_70_part_00